MRPRHGLDPAQTAAVAGSISIFETGVNIPARDSGKTDGRAGYRQTMGQSDLGCWTIIHLQGRSSDAHRVFIHNIYDIASLSASASAS